MREILFRGKHTLTGNWCEGFLVKTGDHFRISTKNDMISFGVVPETVGQYTGLTDKNGKKIFEGDIVIGAWNTMIVIYFDKDYLQFRARKVSAYAQEYSIDYYNNGKMEVIGNIYDNHELLGGAANGE